MPRRHFVGDYFSCACSHSPKGPSLLMWAKSIYRLIRETHVVNGMQSIAHKTIIHYFDYETGNYLEHATWKVSGCLRIVRFFYISEYFKLISIFNFLTLVLAAWKSSAMFLRFVPTVTQSLSLSVAPKFRWPGQQVPLHLFDSDGPFSGMELSDVNRRLRGFGRGLGTGALHSGNWNAASLVGLLGAETVTWGVGGGSCSTAESTKSGRGNRDKSESTRTIGCSRELDMSPDRRGNRSEN